jgi:hypothetical protein
MSAALVNFPSLALRKAAADGGQFDTYQQAGLILRMGGDADRDRAVRVAAHSFVRFGVAEVGGRLEGNGSWGVSG